MTKSVIPFKGGWLISVVMEVAQRAPPPGAYGIALHIYILGLSKLAR